MLLEIKELSYGSYPLSVTTLDKTKVKEDRFINTSNIKINRQGI